LDPGSSPSRCGMHSRPTRFILAIPVLGAPRRLRRPVPSWEGKTVIDASERGLEFSPEEAGRSPVLPPSFAEGAFTGAKFRERFQITWLRPPWLPNPIVEGGHRVVLSVERRRGTRLLPLAALAKQLGFAPVKLGKASKRGVARWWAQHCAGPALGPAHLPGLFQEGAVIDLRSCESTPRKLVRTALTSFEQGARPEIFGRPQSREGLGWGPGRPQCPIIQTRGLCQPWGR